MDEKNSLFTMKTINIWEFNNMDSLLNKVVNNLIPNEPAKIIGIKPLGSKYSIEFIGVNSKKHQEKVFGASIKSTLEVLTEKDTFNFSGIPEHFKLYAEAERIKSAYQFDPLYAVNCSIVDALPHQVEAVYRNLLPLPQIRFLLADDTGAGKTIMTGLLLKEMMMRSLVERILIVTPGGLTKQWQENELAIKFNLNFKLVNRDAFKSDPNIFVSSNLLVTSIDFIRAEDVLNVVKSTSWDLIIVDEAHKLSAFDYGNKRYESRRYKAMEALSSCSEHLLLLTATPHRGRKDTFRNLLQLLDKDIFSSDNMVSKRVKAYEQNGINKFFIRRLKEVMKDWNDKPLFKERHTKTTLYELTETEKQLYDDVTEYVSTRRKKVKEGGNIHVSLALMVMQRRLTSSLVAIRNTLRNRYHALEGVLEEVQKNPGIWKQKMKLDLGMDSLDGFDDLEDEEKDSLEEIFSDPRKFKLFTTAETLSELNEEKEQLKNLYHQADTIVNSNITEAKYQKLMELLKSSAIENDEKLVIFTEHKDTLNYLEERLTKSGGYQVAKIHGGMSADERQAAQIDFARNAQLLIATDAAGEGINLQFCRYLINWDIPWNPNRLEQRMGRIHRYGQKHDVLVFNMVAQNTLEGAVMNLLLEKLDNIREQLGDDRVYDVISDVFEDVGLDAIIETTFNGTSSKYDDYIKMELTADTVKSKISSNKNQIAYSDVDYSYAKNLKERSDEQRLQPIFVKMFFENSFKQLGGGYKEIKPGVFEIIKIPEKIKKFLRQNYRMSIDYQQMHFSFNKQIFLDLHNDTDTDKIIHYINPGNPLFDSLIEAVLSDYKEDMLRGTVLISAEDHEPYLAYFVKSQITDNRQNISGDENVADEKIVMITQDKNGNFNQTSPAKFIDLLPPVDFAKKVELPESINASDVQGWCFENITTPQIEAASERIAKDVDQRREYLEEAFSQIIIDITEDINQMQAKLLIGDNSVIDKISKRQEYLCSVVERKDKRIADLLKMTELDMRPPEVLGCAWVIPLNQVEYNNHYGMSRDDEAEIIAMNSAMDYERKNYRIPEDVSKENCGYDIKSTDAEGIKRYIEVKGRNGDGGVMLSENEYNRLAQLGENAWLYIVNNCKNEPILRTIQDPIKALSFKKYEKGIQYFTSGQTES